MADSVSALGLNRSQWIPYKKPNRILQITLWLLILAAVTTLTGIYPGPSLESLKSVGHNRTFLRIIRTFAKARGKASRAYVN